MKEILKRVDKLLQEAKDRRSQYPPSRVSAFYRGQIVAYTRVGTLLRVAITEEAKPIW